MKHLATAAALVLALAGTFSACGGDDTAAPPRSDGDVDMHDADQHGNGHMGGDHGGASDVAEDARRIEVTASSFEFDPDTITAESGEDIAIVLTSTDILHDLTIDDLDAHVAADRGETEEGGFTAGAPGRYTYYCSVAGHREAGMEGTLVVE